MICKKCGEEIADDSKFCPICGAKIEAEAPAAEAAPVETPAETPATEAPAAEAAPVETPAETPAPEAPAPEKVDPVPTTVDPTVAAKATGKKIADTLRKIPAKVWGIAAAAIVAIIVICNIVSCANNKSPFISSVAKENFIYAAENDLILSSGKKISIDEGIYKTAYNYNSTFIAVLDYDNVLWAVNTKKATKIAEDVADFKVSFYGDTVVYKVKEDKDYSLFFYDVSKKKSKKIYDDNSSEVVISSNGNMVAFRNEEGDIYVSKKGASASKERSEARPLCISDDGKKLFYTKGEKIYRNDDKLVTYEYLGSFYFNVTGDELVFGANGNTYYVAAKATEAVKVKSSQLLSILAPTKTALFGSNTIYTFGVKSFDGVVMNLGGSAYYVSKKGEEAEKIIGSYSSYVMSSDGKSIVYANGGDIYKVANVKKAEEPKKIGKDVDAKYIYASSDLKTVYYATADKELRYLKKDGKGELLADDLAVLTYWGVEYGPQATYDDGLKAVVYVNSDKELCTVKTSKKSKQKLAVGDAENITLATGGKATYALVTDEDYNTNIFIVSSLKKVKKLATVEKEEDYK